MKVPPKQENPVSGDILTSFGSPFESFGASFLHFSRFFAEKDVKRNNFSEVVFSCPFFIAFGLPAAPLPPPEQEVGGMNLGVWREGKTPHSRKSMHSVGEWDTFAQMPLSGAVRKGKRVR